VQLAIILEQRLKLVLQVGGRLLDRPGLVVLGQQGLQVGVHVALLDANALYTNLSWNMKYNTIFYLI